MTDDDISREPDMYTSAASTLRAALKWSVGAFAAVAALMLGTSPLTGIGGLTVGDARLWVALACAFVALAATSALVVGAVLVLTPVDVDLHTIPHAVRRTIEASSATLAALDLRTIDELEATWSARQHPPAPGEPHRPGKVVTATQARTEVIADRDPARLAAAVTEVTAYAAWLILARRWHRFRWSAALLAVLTGTAIVVYSWAANPPDSGEHPIATTAVLPSQPAAAVVVLGDDDRSAFAPVLGLECVDGPVDVIVLSIDDAPAYDLLVEPDDACPLVRLTLVPGVGTSVTSTSRVQVEPPRD